MRVLTRLPSPVKTLELPGNRFVSDQRLERRAFYFAATRPVKEETVRSIRTFRPLPLVGRRVLQRPGRGVKQRDAARCFLENRP